MQQAQNHPQNNPLQAEVSPVISTGGWLGTLLLMSIPIVNIILLIVWAASTGENPTRRNFARAYLVIMLISIIVGVALFLGLGAGMGGLTELMEQYN